MRRSSVLILAAVALASAVAAVVIVIAHRPATQIASGEPLFPQLTARLNDAATLSVVKADGSFDVVRKDDKWVLPGKGSYPVRPELVRGVLIGLAEIKTVEPKTRDAKLYDRLQVDDVGKDARSTELVVKDKGGAVLADLIVGKRRGSIGDPDTNNALLYVRKGGDAQSWLAIGSIEPRTNEVDWAARDVVDIPEDQVTAVTLTGADGASYAIERAKPDDKDFAIRDLPANAKVKAQFDVNAIADVLSSLTFEDVMPATDLATPASGLAKADFATKDGLHVTVTLVPKDKDKWAIFTAAGDGDAAAKATEITQTVAGWAYRLPDYKSSKIETKRADLLESADKPQG
jgi:hypothetical protein